MPDTVINRNLRNNPFERFVTREFRVPDPPSTPIVTLPTKPQPEPLDVAVPCGPPEPIVTLWPTMPAAGDQSALKIKRRILSSAIDGSEIKTSEVLEFVAFMSGHTLDDLTGASRRVPIVYIRQVAMWLAYRFTAKSLPFIGRYLGGRDHTTILHGVNAVKKTIREAAVSPESETPMGWIVPLLTEHVEAGYRTVRTRGVARYALDPAALSALREQALEACRDGKNDQDASVSCVDGGSVLDRGNGSARSGPATRSLHASHSGLPPDADATA